MDSFNSFIKEEKPGLYANIHAKRARIKAGSGEKMRKPGSEGAPSPQDFKDAAKTAKEEYSLEEAVSVKKQNYSWGKMVTVHHGSETSYPLHPEHQAKIKALGDDEKTTFKDETGRHVTAHRSGDTIHLSGTGTSKKTAVARSHFAEEVSPMIKAPKNEFATKADAFAHAKEKGGKVMKKTFTHPTTGQQHVSYVVKEEIDEEQKYYSIVHKTTKKVLSTHKDMASAKDEHRGMDSGVRAHYYVATSTKEPKTFNMKEANEKDTPFTPDAPKKTTGAKPGKYGSEYSRVRHLARMALKQKQKKTNEEVKVEEGKYGSFRVRTTSGSGSFGGPKLPRRPYVPQGDSDPRTGLPLGFSNPPEKSEKPEDKKKMAKEEVELEEALRHKIAGAIGQFIGNKIDPVHGEIMRVHGEEAYRQAAYHIRKTLTGLHDTLKKHLSTGNLQTEAVKMPKPTRAYKEYVRLTGKTPEQRGREEDERQKEMERQRQEYIKQGIIKA